MNDTNDTPSGAPARQSIWMETENAIVNNIMSGLNACGTLKGLVAKAADEANPDTAPLVQFLRGAIRAGNIPRAQEDMQEDKDFAAIRSSEELKRQFAEFIASHVDAGITVDAHLKPLLKTHMENALPGRSFLN